MSTQSDVDLPSTLPWTLQILKAKLGSGGQPDPTEPGHSVWEPREGLSLFPFKYHICHGRLSQRDSWFPSHLLQCTRMLREHPESRVPDAPGSQDRGGWASPCPASTLHCSWWETFCLRTPERGKKYKIKDHHPFITLFFTPPTVQCTSVPPPSPSCIFPGAPLPGTSPVQASSLPFPVFPSSELMLSKSHPQ